MFSGVATQGERRAATRERLLSAAAELFAERGIEGASVDAIAERAERTSGAIYDHFGTKQGLLFALLEGWTGDAAAVIGAEVIAATTLDERLAAIWRTVAHPPSGHDTWIHLEHELWSYAVREPDARDRLARRYRAAWESIDEALIDWARDEGVEPVAVPSGAIVIGVLLGLEMMRRIDPDAVDEAMAVGVLRGALLAARPEGVA
jgi:AcrR family transcriptional regulator